MASGKGGSDSNPPPNDTNTNTDNETPDQTPTPPTIQTTPASPTEASSEGAEGTKEVLGSRLVVPGQDEKDDTKDNSKTIIREEAGPTDYNATFPPATHYNILSPAPLNLTGPRAGATNDGENYNPFRGTPEGPLLPTPGIAWQDPASTSAPDAEPPSPVPVAEEPNDWFTSVDDLAGAGFYPESTNPADARATMTSGAMTSTGKPATSLRTYREYSLAEQLAHVQAEEEEARKNAPLPVPSKTPEVSAFEAYAETSADSECVKLGLAALKAAEKNEVKAMIEILSLLRANGELKEKFEVHNNDLIKFMEDAAKERKVGQYSQEDLEEAYHDHRKAKEAAEKKRDEVQKTLDSLKLTSNAKQNRSNTLLDKARFERTEQQKKNQKLEEELGTLKDQAKADAASIDSLKKQASGKDVEIAMLTGQVNVYSASIDNLKQRATDQDTMIEKFEEKAKSVLAQINDLKQQANDKIAEIEELKTEKKGLISKADCDVLNAKYRTEKEDAVNDFDDLTVKYNDLMYKMEQTEADVKRQFAKERKERAAGNAERTELENVINELKEQVQKDAASIDDLKKQAVDKNAEVKKLEAEKLDLISNDECAARNVTENKRLSDKISELEAEKSELISKTDCDAKIAELNTQLVAANANNTDLLTEEECKNRHAGEKHRLEGRITDLETQLADANANNTNLLTEDQCNDRHAAEKQSLRDTTNALTQERDEALAELQRLRQAATTDPNVQEPEDTRPLREQIAELGEELQKCTAIVLKHKQQLEAHGIFTEDGENSDNIKAENDRLKRQATDNSALVANLTTEKNLLDAEIKNLKAQIATLQAAPGATVTGTGNEENCDDVKAENKRLKEVADKDASLLNVGATNVQLNDDMDDLKNELAILRAAGTATGTGTYGKRIKSLEDSNATLTQVNQELRNQVDSLKKQLADTKKDVDQLKDELKAIKPKFGGGLGGAKKPEDPKVTALKEKVEDHERKEEEYKKENKDLQDRHNRDMVERDAEITSLTQQLKAAKAENDSLTRQLADAKVEIDRFTQELQIARARNQTSEDDRQKIAQLQAAVREKEATIVKNKEHCGAMKKNLEDQIKGLQDAKEDRERQIKSLKKQIADLENGNTGTGGTAGPEPPSPTGASDGKPSDMAMEVVLLRVELALGQLQAERKRSGYIEGDADAAISIAAEAQAMAEILNTATWLGRAALWRGITEWMGSHSTASQSYFDTSNSYDWTEPEHERDMLLEWWNASKVDHVDKTPGPRADPSSPHSPSLSTRSKQNKKYVNKGTQTRKDKKAVGKAKGEKKTKTKKPKTQTQTQAQQHPPVAGPAPEAPPQRNGWWWGTTCSTQ